MKKIYRLILLLIFCCGMFCCNAQTIVKMEQSGGVYKIPCKVNGLSLKFIFDTGASDISISLTEALFMLKNDYLSKNDFIGTEYYRIANGDIQEGTKINLRVIEVGGQKIYNVQASITHTTDAPILFGQSALQRFGKFSLDYSTNTLLLGDKNSGVKASSKICKDIDGNTYKTVIIGSQVWMKENLKVSHYRNGDTIKEAKSTEEWINWGEAGTDCWGFHDYKLVNGNTYGKLYNWYAATDPRDLCPTGWHVPSDAEWHILALSLDSQATWGNPDRFERIESEVAGGKMKAITFWESPNTGATNSSGFTALPAGESYNPAYYIDVLGYNGFFWSSTPNESNSAWIRFLYYDSSVLGRSDNHRKSNLFSVRCVED